jgi:F1F0 ATPase subunit 2
MTPGRLDAAGIASALVVGIALGAVLFGGLWATTARLSTARSPAGLLVGSAIARLGLVAPGLLLVARSGLVALSIVVVSMVLVRTVVVRAVLARSGRAASPEDLDR